MKKMLMPGDSVIIDGKEITYNKIKQNAVDSYKYEQLSAFLQMKFSENGGVASE